MFTTMMKIFCVAVAKNFLFSVKGTVLLLRVCVCRTLRCSCQTFPFPP